MARGAEVNASVVSEGSEAAVLVKGSPGSALSLISVTTWVSFTGLGSVARVSVWLRISIVIQPE